MWDDLASCNTHFFSSLLLIKINIRKYTKVQQFSSKVDQNYIIEIKTRQHSRFFNHWPKFSVFRLALKTVSSTPEQNFAAIGMTKLLKSIIYYPRSRLSVSRFFPGWQFGNVSSPFIKLLPTKRTVALQFMS